MRASLQTRHYAWRGTGRLTIPALALVLALSSPVRAQDSSANPLGSRDSFARRSADSSGLAKENLDRVAARDLRGVVERALVQRGR
jgi:hypothetical protein